MSFLVLMSVRWWRRRGAWLTASPPPTGNTQQGAPIQILGPVHVQANDTNQLHSELNQQTSMAANRMGTSPRGSW
ncbi:phage tail tape measure protein, family protein, core region [Mycobacterium europaeum]|uniref:Phage tail tape measure protein, family protein, core region n=1 Tax=Mycobacterium europaeum TaxID=761804 RepID=A0A0U1DSM2_9MYCO|nr:hypothetical protein [Mycobacterium europaeum]CQD21929.1 phage tail tape measure protein, family protein, core region [Mycobacterium europaeum]